MPAKFFPESRSKSNEITAIPEIIAQLDLTQNDCQ